MSKKKKKTNDIVSKEENEMNAADEPLPLRDCLKCGNEFQPTITNSRICEPCRKSNSRYSDLAQGVGWQH